MSHREAVCPLPLILALACACFTPDRAVIRPAAPRRVSITVLELWEPACLKAVPELSRMTDPDAFEEAAFQWLMENEASVAADIAASHKATLVSWRHDSDHTDNTPFGATIVVLSPSGSSKDNPQLP